MHEDQIIAKLLQLEDQMATKEDLKILRNDIFTVLDQQTVILKRLDEERYFTTERVRQIEADVHQLKVHLHLV